MQRSGKSQFQAAGTAKAKGLGQLLVMLGVWYFQERAGNEQSSRRITKAGPEMLIGRTLLAVIKTWGFYVLKLLELFCSGLLNILL